MLATNIRPINIQTDLEQIADLLYTCFRDSMDMDGERYIQYLKRFSRAKIFSRAALNHPERYALPGEGFVCECDGRIVGNITLSTIPFDNKFVYQISNVAVEQDLRGEGIAKRLTEVALRYVESREIHQVWLQAKHDNKAAIHLYESYAFSTFAKRTTWRNQPGSLFLASEAPKTIQKRKSMDWEFQRRMLQELHPAEVLAAYGIHIDEFRPGFPNHLRDVLQNRVKVHWRTSEGPQSAFITYDLIPYKAYTNLWLAFDQELSMNSIGVLAIFAHRRIGGDIRINLPQGIGIQQMEMSGLVPLNTLFWMKRSLV